MGTPSQAKLIMKVQIDDAPVIVAAGMDFEARIAKGPGVRAVYGQKRDKYVQDLHSLARAGARGIISFGTAGGLSPALKPGDVVVASSVVTAKSHFQTHAHWAKSLRDVLPYACSLPVFGAEGPVLSVLEKEALWDGTGAGAVDMESRMAAEVAEHYGLPLAVLRVVIDPAHRAIPISAAVGVRDNGTTNPAAVVRSLVRRPRDIPEIIRLADDTRRASKALHACRLALGPFFGLVEAVDLPLNVE